MTDVEQIKRDNQAAIESADRVSAELRESAERAREIGDRARAGLDNLVAQRDRLQRLFNRLEAAISHHKQACEQNDVPDVHDEALWAARDRILKDAHEGKG
jgi:ABC-type transporter Mla subunit MlaD